jgi:DNA-binding protein HU-beta
MSKTELVAAIAERTGLTKKDSEAAVNAFIGTVTEQLKKGEKVQLIGFGTFEVSERAERVGRNPQTGAEMTIAASKVPKFKAGKALKELLN